MKVSIPVECSKILIVAAAILLMAVLTAIISNPTKTVQGKILDVGYRSYEDNITVTYLRIRDDKGRNYDVAAVKTITELKEGQIVEVTFARFEVVLGLYIGGRHYNGVVVWGTEEKLSDGEYRVTSEHVRFKRIVSYRILKEAPKN